MDVGKEVSAGSPMMNTIGQRRNVKNQAKPIKKSLKMNHIKLKN